MAFLELLLGVVVTGLGFVLAAVGAVAYRSSRLRKMALTAAAFAAAGGGGAAYTLLLLSEGASSASAPLALAIGTVASLLLFFFALFGSFE